jgi:hypothetical protein
MATLVQIKNAIETFRINHQAKFINRQENYLANHGTYWQGIITHTILPDDGATTAPDLNTRPTDQQERWNDVFVVDNLLPATWPCSITVDIYNGSLGKGWTLTVKATKDGNTYSRTWNVGPETHRAIEWHIERSVL